MNKYKRWQSVIAYNSIMDITIIYLEIFKMERYAFRRKGFYRFFIANSEIHIVWSDDNPDQQ